MVTDTPTLVTAYRLADGPASMLLMHGSEVACQYEHPTGLGGICRLGDRIYTVDRGGAFFCVDVGSRGIDLEEVGRASTAEDAHDLTAYGRSLAVACPQQSVITVLAPETGKTSVIRPWAAKSDYPDPYHFNSLLRYGDKWLLSMFTRDPRRPSSGWAETPSDSGAIMGWEQDQWDRRPFADGICMPHSLRAHRSLVWWCDSGNLALANSSGLCERFPNLTRGLDFRDSQGALGLSSFRNVRPANLQAAGYALFDVQRPDRRQVFRLPDVFQEVYDVLLLETVSPKNSSHTIRKDRNNEPHQR